MERTIAPIGEHVRLLHPVQPNPFGDEPSSDVGKFGVQVLKMAKDGVKAAGNPTAVVKTLGKLVGGTLFEGAIREKWKAKAADARAPLFDSVADGLTGAIEPTFKRQTYNDSVKQGLSDDTYRAFSRLNDDEKESVAAYLVENARTHRDDQVGEPRSALYISEKLSGTHQHPDVGGNIKYAAQIWFQREHYQRD
jgi:hypothetical protein